MKHPKSDCPVLSVIVPVYNKEEFIDECVQSILAQTFTDFELILVNDGSTDKSGACCDYYQQVDNRVIVIHQENNGVSSARNRGISQAMGRFIGFVDSDDWIMPDMFSLLINNAELHHADVSICDTRRATQKTTIRITQEKLKVFNGREKILSAFFHEGLGMGVINKVYKREVIANTRFEGSMFEDVFFIFKVLLNVTNVVVSSEAKYLAIVRYNSVSISKFGPQYFQITETTKKMVDTISKLVPTVLDDAKVLDAVMNISQLNLLLINSDKSYQDEYDQTVSYLSRYRTFAKRNNKVRFKHRLALRFFYAFPKFYALAMEFYCIVTDKNIVKRTYRTTMLKRWLYWR